MRSKNLNLLLKAYSKKNTFNNLDREFNSYQKQNTKASEYSRLYQQVKRDPKLNEFINKVHLYVPPPQVDESNIDTELKQLQNHINNYTESLAKKAAEQQAKLDKYQTLYKQVTKDKSISTFINTRFPSAQLVKNVEESKIEQETTNLQKYISEYEQYQTLKNDQSLKQDLNTVLDKYRAQLKELEKTGTNFLI